MRFPLICTFMLLLAVSALARILNVPEEYATIQAGIDASVNGDTVLVAPGEYTENDTIQDRNILLTSAEGPTATLVHGKFSLLGALIDTTCILRGFRINGEGISGWPDNLVRIETGSPIIWGNIIEENDNNTWGAGIMSLESGLIIRGNIIRNNWSCAVGAGIWAADMDTTIRERVIIEGNIISGNQAGMCIVDQGDYAGIWMSAIGVVRFNLITDNFAFKRIYYASGGGLRAVASSMQIYNNTIVGNSAGGGPLQDKDVAGACISRHGSPTETDLLRIIL